MNGDRYEAAFALAFIGLRQGEILGLAWQEVDLEGARGHGPVIAAGIRREGGAAST
jgi:integrase